MKESKTALITGITGQDGSYLAELLINKGYSVHGLVRRSSTENTSKIDHLLKGDEQNKSIKLHYGDLTDSTNITRIINLIQPDEIYNLGAQSHVKISFESPEYTAQTDALGPLRILESVRLLGLKDKTKIYQASTSELFGLVKEIPQTETTPFHPRSPYGIAKLYAYWITINYREAYGMYACNGILFNHESPRRGETFVTRKVSRGLSRINSGLDSCLFMGNLDSKRDWGHAREYIEMQWLMLQQEKPEDFVIASGRMETVRKFIEICASKLGWNRNTSSQSIIWEGKGLDEIGRRADTKEIVIRIDSRYFRATEVDELLGNSNKALKQLGWKPKINLEELATEMIEIDKKEASKEYLLREKGFTINSPLESPPAL